MRRTWLITGSSRGLGMALARAVLASGDQLVATARDPGALADLTSLGADRVILMPLDVTDAAAAARVVSSAVAHFGRLDILVNNAGYGNVAPIEDTSIEEVRAQIETNLFGTIIMTKAAIRLFREQRRGHFFQISSIGGRAGATGRGPYSAAKFGVEGFSEVLAAEMAPFGVHVTIVEPGGFRTDFAGTSTRISAGDPARAAQAIITVAAADNPPLRLVLGRDAFARAERTDEARLAELRAWRDMSSSTDFTSQ